MSELVKKLIEENLQSKEATLDLGNCGLDGTEPILELLGECEHLETLILSDGGIKRGEQITYLRQLPQNLPKGLKKLVANGVSRGIKDLSPLSHLSQLEYLSLRGNSIESIIPLASLISLKELILRGNHITTIEALSKCLKLESLELELNQISDIKPLAKLAKLRTLFLSYNDLTNIDPLQYLIHLQVLMLNDNQISNIKPLQNLVNLEGLVLDDCFISDTRPLENLQQLLTLHLSNNGIRNIDFLKNLKQLERLHLVNNKITNISLDFLNNFPQLKTLDISNNPLENIPPELHHSGVKAIRNYLKSVEKQEDRRPLYEAKLIFVGVGDVGKTELAEAISQPNYEFSPGRASTKGIRIKQWYPPNCEVDDEEVSFTANIWDFAGQEINYGTHQFFLTKNSVYVFVWETRKGEQTEAFNYWLRIVSLLSDNAPIIVVQNKTDVYESEIDRKNWQKRFPNIVGFLKTSCKTGQGIDILRDTVIDELLELPHIREIWNKNRFAVRQALEQHEADYIAKREYLKICEKHQVNRTDAGYLSSQLHDIGAILHFSTEPKLKNTIVLKPQWATEAAYLLRDSDQVVQGRFTLHDLDEIWHEDRFADMHSFLLGLMEQFELIFQLQDDIKYIIPELLPSDTPPRATSVHPAANEARHLRFEYHYDFMPKGIMSRFICRVHELIHEELFWKYGVVLAYEQSQAKVLWDDTGVHKIIAIEVWGAEADKLLFLIRNHFEHIHAKLNHPPLTEKVPCVCPPDCPHKANPQLHDYKTLLKFQAKGKATRVCDKSVEDVSIQAMLEGISDNENSDLQHLLELINANNMTGFFELLDDLGVEEQQLSALRDQFVHGSASFQYADRLKVWVQDYFKRRRFF